MRQARLSILSSLFQVIQSIELLGDTPIVVPVLSAQAPFFFFPFLYI
jgi:hypothetical protein